MTLSFCRTFMTLPPQGGMEDRRGVSVTLAGGRSHPVHEADVQSGGHPAVRLAAAEKHDGRCSAGALLHQRAHRTGTASCDTGRTHHPCIQTLLRCDGVLLLRAGRRCGSATLAHPSEEDGIAAGEVGARPAARVLLRIFIHQAGAKITPKKMGNVLVLSCLTFSSHPATSRASIKTLSRWACRACVRSAQKECC